MFFLFRLIVLALVVHSSLLNAMLKRKNDDPKNYPTFTYLEEATVFYKQSFIDKNSWRIKIEKEYSCAAISLFTSKPELFSKLKKCAPSYQEYIKKDIENLLAVDHGFKAESGEYGILENNNNNSYKYYMTENDIKGLLEQSEKDAPDKNKIRFN